jgi:Uma2 family endonuclease
LEAGVPAHDANESDARPPQPAAGPAAPLRVRVLETGLATYPDITVVCGALETDPDDPHGVTNPTVLVEVLSPSTEKHDREVDVKAIFTSPLDAV